VQQPGSCGDGEHNSCGPVIRSFYNIRTGQSRFEFHQKPSTIADLNSPKLFRSVCRPLQVPGTSPGPQSPGVLPPSLTFHGPFAIASAVEGSVGSVFLERCGSHLKIPIGISQPGGTVASVVANRHVVIWESLDLDGAWHGQFAGLMLPSLRRFSATAPSNLLQHGGGAGPIALSAFRLYLTDADGRLWAARTPR
jgi:hypothetical protein